jgi:hypothetical protein
MRADEEAFLRQLPGSVRASFPVVRKSGCTCDLLNAAMEQAVSSSPIGTFQASIRVIYAKVYPPPREALSRSTAGGEEIAPQGFPIQSTDATGR